MPRSYTQLILDLQEWTIKNDIDTAAPLLISFGQIELENLIMADGIGLPSMEKSLSFTPGLLKDTNSFQLPTDYLSMLYIAPTDQLPSPVVSLSSTSGTLTAGTYYYRVTAINSYGETLGSEEKSITVGATAGVTLTWTAITDVTGYKIYGRSVNSALFIASTTNTTYTDTGSITPTTAIPTFNTSGKTRYRPMIRNMSKEFGDLRGNYIDKENKGMPCVFERMGDTLYFDKYADMNYGIDFRYYKRATALSEASPTNEWTEDKYYKALLASCFVESIPYFRDDPGSKAWQLMLDKAVYAIKSVNARERISGNKSDWVGSNVFFSGKG